MNIALFALGLPVGFFIGQLERRFFRNYPGVIFGPYMAILIVLAVYFGW
jgi:hypothetical protein